MQSNTKSHRAKAKVTTSESNATPPSGGNTQAPDAAPLAFRVHDFCVRLGVSPSTFWKYAALGKIHTIRIGGRTLIPADEAARILREGVQ